LKFTISIFQDEDGMFIAECPSIPGCVSQGQTEQEAEKNIQEAINSFTGWPKKYNSVPSAKKRIPRPTMEAVVKVIKSK